MQESTINFDDPPERAGQLAEAAIASMARLGVAPTPTNFLIWYSHCSMRHTELSEALLNLESGGAPFTASLCAKLYERFFGPVSQVRVINDICERIEATMARLLEEIDGMSADAGAYGGGRASPGQAGARVPAHGGHRSLQDVQ